MINLLDFLKHVSKTPTSTQAGILYLLVNVRDKGPRPFVAKISYPDADYFLWSDADFIWEMDKSFDKHSLTEERYMITHRTKYFSYERVTYIRLIKSNIFKL